MHAVCGFLGLPFRWQLALSVIGQNRAKEFVFQNDTTQETKTKAGIYIRMCPNNKRNCSSAIEFYATDFYDQKVDSRFRLIFLGTDSM